MLELYPQIKTLHVACVLLSGAIFASRGLAMLAESRWSKHPVPRFASYINDSILLTAGLLLMQVTGQYPGAQSWLSVKLTMLVVYVGLGIAALWLRRSRPVRIACLAGAVAVYLFMITVARSHDPWGIWHAI